MARFCENLFDMPKSEWTRLIDEWIIGSNAERDRALIKRRLFDGVCFEPLAEEFGLSVQQVKSIFYKRMRWLELHVGR
jgi:hypothetical protein